jgi:hypothetical protein
MCEKYGLERWIFPLMKVLNDRNLELPAQLEHFRRRSTVQAGGEQWTIPSGAVHVLEWERDLINEIENTIYEALMFLDTVHNEFGPEFKELLGIEDLDPGSD